MARTPAPLPTDADPFRPVNKNRQDDLLIAETIRFIEADGPLDDDEANRRAAAIEGNREQRLLARAAVLGERLGLPQELQAWRSRALIAWAGLGLLVFIAGYGLLQGLLGAGRTINVMLAFIGALGMHFLTLALWLLSFVSGGGTSALTRLSLGNLLLRLASTHAGPGRRSPMLQAALSLLARARLLPWLFGLAAHAVWSIAFVLALAGLWIMFSFREYRLTWETTIQSSQFFIAFIEASGALPRLLGFPVPSAADLGADSAAAQRLLAWWLIGCTFVYGLLPRLLLTLLSAAVLARRRRALGLDAADPYYRKLLARIDLIGRSKVVEPERRAADDAGAAHIAPAARGQGAALVGFELPPECPWPPAEIGAVPALAINVSGSGDQRREALDRLQAQRPERILFICDQSASPDRGTARFLREARASGARASLLLLPVRGGGEAFTRRWQDWLADSGLQPLPTFEGAAAASAWLEGRDE